MHHPPLPDENRYAELYGEGIGNPDLDWRFTTVPQVALNGNVVSQPRGKMLGGSSGLNFMVWDRGSAKEYDAWEQVSIKSSFVHTRFLILTAAWSHGMELEIPAPVFQEDGDKHTPDARRTIPRSD